jgi:hypothetical protein
LPYDLDEVGLSEYKQLDSRWQDWKAVQSKCVQCVTAIFDFFLESG